MLAFIVNLFIIKSINIYNFFSASNKLVNWISNQLIKNKAPNQAMPIYERERTLSILRDKGS